MVWGVHNESNNLNNNMPLTRLDATFRTSSLLVADTAAMANYIMINTPFTNIHPTKTQIKFFLADSSHIKSTHEGELDLPMLPPAAQTVHLLPKLNQKHYFPLDNCATTAALQSSQQQM
jgi:hypothetical protein